MILISLSVKTGRPVTLSSARAIHGSIAQAAPAIANAIWHTNHWGLLLSNIIFCAP
jgi:hypothetical protein